MPTPDAFGQGIPLPSLTDAPDGPKALADLAAGLLPRAVPKYASASERGATITAPQEGQLAWLRDSNLLTIYDGAAWSVIAAGTQAWTTVSLASGYSHNGNDNGTLQYRTVNLFGEKTLMLRGGLTVTYPGSGGVIANAGVVTSTSLPAAARPTAIRSLTGACSTISSDALSVKIDIRPTGTIEIVGTTTTTAKPRIQPPWVSFTGCFCSL